MVNNEVLGLDVSDLVSSTWTLMVCGFTLRSSHNSIILLPVIISPLLEQERYL